MKREVVLPRVNSPCGLATSSFTVQKNQFSFFFSYNFMFSSFYLSLKSIQALDALHQRGTRTHNILNICSAHSTNLAPLSLILFSTIYELLLLLLLHGLSLGST
jgi:hypothetical protein